MVGDVVVLVSNYLYIMNFFIAVDNVGVSGGNGDGTGDCVSDFRVLSRATLLSMKSKVYVCCILLFTILC